MHTLRKRLQYAILAILLILIALGLRAIWACLPFWINIWIGDFLWALMLYCLGIAVFMPPDKYKYTLALVVFCWLIEGSQAIHLPGLDAFRSTRLGGLLLGHGFLWSDIVAYTAGAIAGYLLDVYHSSRLAK